MKQMIASILSSVTCVFSTFYGSIVLMISSILAFFQPESICFYVVLGAVVADLFWGVLAARKCKKFLLSKAFRDTATKIGIYAFTMVGAFCIEKILHNGGLVGVKIVAVIAAACELWSMSASMLIVKHDMPFLKIFRIQLKGEIESKLVKNAETIITGENK